MLRFPSVFVRVLECNNVRGVEETIVSLPLSFYLMMAQALLKATRLPLGYGPIQDEGDGGLVSAITRLRHSSVWMKAAGESFFDGPWDKSTACVALYSCVAASLIYYLILLNK
ncbi:hypothetical protein GWK47_029279 [Chionoecetes opilio]|uniref:Uncharacterized protein n=1 Tax=Chionoecetes opilio TaxID=41210 RepID=A0A8J4YN63_CHIOP|nr:hypothetical protein GWK47_029279 [Chionoecetes opilio]